MPRNGKRYPERIGKIYRFRRKDSIAIKALKMAHNIKNLINVEYKKHDVNVSTTVSSTGALNCLSLIAQGDTNSTRTGNSILKKYFQVNGYVVGSSSSGNDVNEIRVIFFEWRRNDGASPTISDVLTDTAEPKSYYDPYLTKKSDMKIIKDFRIYITPRDQGNPNMMKAFKVRHTFPENSHAKYDGTDALIGDTVSGQIFYLILSDQSTNVPSIEFQTRLTYIDN